MRLHLLVAALLATLPVAVGQSTFGLAGFGYSIPQAAITAAPGHILMFSITGLQTRLAAPLKHNGEPYPLELGGVSVLLFRTVVKQPYRCSVFSRTLAPYQTALFRLLLRSSCRTNWTRHDAQTLRWSFVKTGQQPGLIPVVPVHDPCTLSEIATCPHPREHIVAVG